MGEVYAAHDPHLDRPVALKLVRMFGAGEGSDGSLATPASILREARAAAAINHPNAVSLYEMGQVGDVPYLTMELVEGRTLRALVGDASVSVGRRVHWLVDVGRAIEAAHARGVVHRDIKPENVMVRADGVVKVLDFGIARRYLPSAEGGPPAPLSTATSGAGAGTPLYMSPEQLRGLKIDARVDQFAWGLVAFELLAGRHPWGGARTGLSTVAAIVGEPVPRLRELVPALSPHIEETITRALAKAPADRFPTMRALLERLWQAG
jgi:serine/threonine-protein kinase